MTVLTAELAAAFLHAQMCAHSSTHQCCLPGSDTDARETCAESETSGSDAHGDYDERSLNTSLGFCSKKKTPSQSRNGVPIEQCLIHPFTPQQPTPGGGFDNPRFLWAGMKYVINILAQVPLMCYELIQ